MIPINCQMITFLLCLCASMSFGQMGKKVAPPKKGERFLLMDQIYKEWNGTSFKWGFYNTENDSLLTKATFDTLLYVYEPQKKRSLFVVQQNKKWGLMDAQRAFIIPAEYDVLEYDSRSSIPYILVEQGGKKGVFAPNGKPIINCAYDQILYDGFQFKVTQKNKIGLLDLNGKELIPVCMDKMLVHPELDKTLLEQDKKWTAWAWAKAKPCAPPLQFDYVDRMMQHFVVRNGSKFGVYDSKGGQVLALKYDYIAPFYLKFLNTAIVGQNKKVGLYRIDSVNKVHTVVPIRYDHIWVEEDSRKLKVQLGDKKDYFWNDTTLFNLAYNDVKYYVRIDRFMVKSKKLWGIADFDGTVEVPIRYNKIMIIDKNNFLVERKGKWGLINGKGDELIPVKYDEIDYRHNDDLIFIKRKGKWGLATAKRGVILDAAYQELYV